MNKKIINILSVLLVLFCVTGLSGCRENRSFSFVRVGDFYAVTGGIPDSEGHLAIPARHRGIDVIMINYSAFKGNEDIKSAFIPNTIETIHSWAFKDTINMRNIEFESNSRLQAIVSGGNVLDGNFGERDAGAFENSGIESIVLPRSLKWIGRQSFLGTKNLERVDFEANSLLDTIAFAAFANSSIEWIRFPASLRVIGMSAFSLSSNLRKIVQEQGSILERIESNAFRNTTSLISFIIPTSVIELSTFVFYGWESHQTIYVQERSKVPGFPGGNNNATIIWNAPVYL